MGDRSQVYYLRIRPSHPGPTQPGHPSVSKMSTGDGYGHRWGRKGEFCVTVDPVTRTADILTQSVEGVG